MLISRCLAVGGAVLLSIGAFGCDYVPTQAQASVGVSAAQPSALTVHIVLCDEERVTRIALVDTHGDNPGATSNQTLWEITSAAGVEASTVPVGTLPEGFSGSGADIELRDGTTYALIVDTTDVTGVSVAFRRDEVGDLVLTGDGAELTERDFSEHGEEGCE